MEAAANQLATRSSSAAQLRKGRSAVTNGRRLHVVRPGDTAWARRFRDVLAEIVSDLSGPDGLSEGQRQLARRCATIAIACEKMEGEAAAGNDIDIETYGTLTDRLGRCFQRLGLERRTRDAGSLSLRDRLQLEADAAADWEGGARADVVPRTGAAPEGAVAPSSNDGATA
jgi:hypothetical protein